MSNELIQPYAGPKAIDLASIAALLVDLAPGALRGLRREQPGIDAVAAELAVSVPALGVKAAIAPDVYADFKDAHALIQQIRALRIVAVKVAEVLTESEAYYEDRREGDISLMTAAIRTAGRRRDESILASFEKTLVYNGQIARKGVKTRQKKAGMGALGEPSVSGNAVVDGVGTGAGAGGGAP